MVIIDRHPTDAPPAVADYPFPSGDDITLDAITALLALPDHDDPAVAAAFLHQYLLQHPYDPTEAAERRYTARNSILARAAHTAQLLTTADWTLLRQLLADPGPANWAAASAITPVPLDGIAERTLADLVTDANPGYPAQGTDGALRPPTAVELYHGLRLLHGRTPDA